MSQAYRRLYLSATLLVADPPNDKHTLSDSCDCLNSRSTGQPSVMAASPADPHFLYFPQLPKEIRLIIWRAALPGPRLVDIRQRPIKETIGLWETRTGKEWPEMIGILKDRDNVEDSREDDILDVYSVEGSSEDSRGTPVNAQLGDEAEGNRNSIRLEMGHAISSHYFVSYKEASLLGIFSESCVPHILYACKEAEEVFLQHYTLAFHCTGSIPQTYFDFSIDTLYLRYDTFSYYFRTGDIGSLSLDLEYRCRIEDMENLRKVKKLAILFNNDTTEMPEVDLASILGLFGGVKELIIVLRHFIDKDKFKHYVKDSQDLLEQSQLILVEPRDVEKAITHFYEIHPPSLSWRVPRRLRDVANVNSKRLDMETLERYRLVDCAEGEFPWEMPTINQKVVVPWRLKKELDVAKMVARR